MNNTWIVFPVKDNAVDASKALINLTGGFSAPEKYEVRSINLETQEIEIKQLDHPYFGEKAPNFSNRIIFINFEQDYTELDGVTHIADSGEVNIYRAWNTGIDYAIANGADSVVLLNALTEFDPFAIVEAKNKLDESGSEVVNISDGGMLIVSSNSSIRADDQFRIWFGDNDLYDRAAEVTTDSKEVFGNFNHIEDWSDFNGFEEIIKEDQLRYEAKRG